MGHDMSTNLEDVHISEVDPPSDISHKVSIKHYGINQLTTFYQLVVCGSDFDIPDYTVMIV